MRIWHAEYTTRHFFFEAFGSTAAKAVAALTDGLKTHARQCELASDEWYNAGDINVRELQLDRPYRDRQPL